MLKGIENNLGQTGPISMQDLFLFVKDSVLAHRSETDVPNQNPMAVNKSGLNPFRIIAKISSGTLTEDEKWSCVHHLTGNVYVPSGKTLTIESGATIYLDGYYIQSSGTGKIIKNGVVADEKIYVKSGNDIKAIYPSNISIQQAVDSATSGHTVYLAPGTYYETVYMKSGVNLKGNSRYNTTITGYVRFNSVNNATLENVTVQSPIDLNYS
ncbi:MAG: hypothetical protein ACTSQP_23985, partial [Promethearchaeota archaeon]